MKLRSAGYFPQHRSARHSVRPLFGVARVCHCGRTEALGKDAMDQRQLQARKVLTWRWTFRWKRDPMPERWKDQNPSTNVRQGKDQNNTHHQRKKNGKIQFMQRDGDFRLESTAGGTCMVGQKKQTRSYWKS